MSINLKPIFNRFFWLFHSDTPVCISESKEFQFKFGESVNISCYVNAEPNDVTFFWSINDSIDDHSHQHSYLESHNQVGINENDDGDLLMESKTGTVKSSWIESVLNYKPKKFQDFSVINCWGQNKVGSQRFPCQFNVTMTPLPAPDSIESCSLNSTLTSINIDCFIHGHNEHKLNDNVDRENVDHGFHDSLFHLEVLDSRKALLANMTSSSPNFLLENLNSGKQIFNMKEFAILKR